MAQCRNRIGLLLEASQEDDTRLRWEIGGNIQYAQEVAILGVGRAGGEEWSQLATLKKLVQAIIARRCSHQFIEG